MTSDDSVILNDQKQRWIQRELGIRHFNNEDSFATALANVEQRPDKAAQVGSAILRYLSVLTLEKKIDPEQLAFIVGGRCQDEAVKRGELAAAPDSISNMQSFVMMAKDLVDSDPDILRRRLTERSNGR